MIERHLDQRGEERRPARRIGVHPQLHGGKRPAGVAARCQVRSPSTLPCQLA
jgi:hypothetical protein